MIRCTVGVFAHNEAHNVQRTLRALLSQELQHVSISEIIVVASGCTDDTVELAQEIAAAHPVVAVQVETHRSGKAAAIRQLMSVAQGEVIVFVGADTLPAPDAIERLVEPFSDPTVGMTGARVIPLNSPVTFLGFAVQMLWHVHHRLALRKPKLGELVACRNVIADFPEDTATDDLALEALITHSGYRLVYAPKAVVYNRGPENVPDFVLQRRRIFAGEVGIALKYRYFASSLSLRNVVPLAIHAMTSYPRYLPWTFGVMALELWSRALGAVDAVSGREEYVWRHAKTTKKVVTASEPVTLVCLRWSPTELDSSSLLLQLQQLPQSVGSVFWWDTNHGEMFLKVAGGDPAMEWIQSALLDGSHAASAHRRVPAPRISLRLIQLASHASPPAS